MNAVCIVGLILALLSGEAVSQDSGKDIVEAAWKSARKIREDFININLRRERDFRYELSSRAGENNDNLYRALDDEVFKPEESKANALLDSLSNTQEVKCIQRLKDVNSNVRDRDTRNEYRYCFADVESQAKQVVEKLNEAQDNVNALESQAEQVIYQCERVFNLRGNLTLLVECVTDARKKLKNVSEDLETSLKVLTKSKYVLNVAECVDKTVIVVKKALNGNYDIIAKCFASFNSSLGNKFSSIISSSYLYEVSSNAKADVTEALANLKADPEVVLVDITKMRTKVEETLSGKNKNWDTVRAALAKNENVKKFEMALYNASTSLFLFNNAKSCVNDAQFRFRENLNSRTNDIRRCLDGIRQTITTGDVNNLEYLVLERKKKEGQVALVQCLSSSGTLQSNNTVICSAQADASFQTFLTSIKMSLNQINQKAEVIVSKTTYCEGLVLPSLILSQISNKYKFESCLMDKISLNFTLNID